MPVQGTRDERFVRGIKHTSSWRWRQQDPSKRWYPTTSLHSVTSQ